MSIPSDPAFRLPLAALLAASTVLGACGSSGGGGDDPADDAPGGAVTVPDGGGDDADPTGPGTGSGGMPSEDTAGGSPDMTGGEPTPPLDGDGTATVVTNGVLGAISGRTTRFGTVQIDQPSNGDAGFVSAGFFRTNLPLPVDQAVASFVPPLDTCTVTRIETDGGLPDVDDLDFDFDVESLSAGETLTFTSPAGTWLTLMRQEAFGFIGYGTEDALPQPVPSGLRLDIPGDTFPTFADVRVPDVAPLSGAMPLEAVTPDTTFRWQAAGDDPSVYVRIDVTSGGFGLPGGLPPEVIDSLPDGIPGFGGGPLTTLDCVVRDDGEFTLPAATRAELGDDFSGSATFARLGTTAVQRGDTLLLVFNESSVN